MQYITRCVGRKMVIQVGNLSLNQWRHSVSGHQVATYNSMGPYVTVCLLFYSDWKLRTHKSQLKQHNGFTNWLQYIRFKANLSLSLSLPLSLFPSQFPVLIQQLRQAPNWDMWVWCRASSNCHWFIISIKQLSLCCILVLRYYIFLTSLEVKWNLLYNVGCYQSCDTLAMS